MMASSEGCMRWKSLSEAVVPKAPPVTHPVSWSLALGLEVCNRVRCLLHIFGLKPLSLFLRPSRKDHIRVAEM